MRVTFYNVTALAYSNRNRFKDIIDVPILGTDSVTVIDNHRSIDIGNGDFCYIVTKAENKSTYVTIENQEIGLTRWYVTDTSYLNGGQIQLNLVRDVVGEFGLENVVGKVERGITSGALKYRSELSVNQVLKNRERIQTEIKRGEITIEKVKAMRNYVQYGNMKVLARSGTQDLDSNPHSGEQWGVVYFKIPEEKQTFELAPTQQVFGSGEPIENNTTIATRLLSGVVGVIEFDLFYNFTALFSTQYPRKVHCRIEFNRENVFSDYTYRFIFSNEEKYELEEHYTSAKLNSANHIEILGTNRRQYKVDSNQKLLKLAQAFCNKIITAIQEQESTVYYKPASINVNTSSTFDATQYDNVYYKEESIYYLYKVQYGTRTENGICDKTGLQSYLIGPNGKISNVGGTFEVNIDNQFYEVYCASSLTLNATSLVSYYKYDVTKEIKSPTDLNMSLVIETDISKSVYEPFTTLVCPLYDCIIYDDNNGNVYYVDGKQAWDAFNKIINKLSGDNGWLIDAQVIPYCPPLIAKATSVTEPKEEKKVTKLPLFYINNGYFSYDIVKKVNVYENVKKDYIQRKYNIKSPDQSNDFLFDLYDYIAIEDKNDEEQSLETLGTTTEKDVTFRIKCVLKPFDFICCCGVVPSEGSIKNSTYESELMGCVPSNNGFEATLTSNAFETYKRENANYQQIFNTQLEELQKQHQVEKVNEKVQAVVNTITATSMGAIGGAAMSNASVLGTSFSGAIGASIGGAAAGLTVGIAQNRQIQANEKLREYEEYLLQKNYDLQIGTIKKVPNSVNRISSYNNLIMQDFAFILETYDTTTQEDVFVTNFIYNYGYAIGVIDNISKYTKNACFVKGNVITSNLNVALNLLLDKELQGGIYYYE